MMTRTDSLKQLITAWQEADSLETAAATLKRPIPVIQRQVEFLKSKGVELQNLTSNVVVETVDFEALKTFLSSETKRIDDLKTGGGVVVH